MLSTRGQAHARIASAKQAIEQNRLSELAEVMVMLRGVGRDSKDSGAIIDALDRHPDLLLKVKTAFELQCESHALTRGGWKEGTQSSY